MVRTFAFVVLLLTPSVIDALSNSDPVTERIVGMAIQQQGASLFLQELTDNVGGRMTGTPESLAAAQLILSTLHTPVSKMRISKSSSLNLCGIAVPFWPMLRDH